MCNWFCSTAQLRSITKYIIKLLTNHFDPDCPFMFTKLDTKMDSGAWLSARMTHGTLPTSSLPQTGHKYQ